jgi:hypothetical protein
MAGPAAEQDLLAADADRLMSKRRGGFRTPAPYTGPIARAGPASETLPECGRSRGHHGTTGIDPVLAFDARDASASD